MTRKTVSGLGWQFGSVASTAVLQILVTAVLARRVSPEAFGLVALAQVATTFITMFAQAGISAAIIQRSKLTSRHIQVGFTATLILGVLATVFLWALAPALAQFFSNKALVRVLRAISLNFTLVSLGAVSRALLERQFRFRLLMQLNVTSYVVGYAVIGVTMAVLDFGIWALVAAIVGQNLVMGILLFIASPHSLRLDLSGAELRDLVGYGGGLTLSQFFNNIALQADNLVIGRLLSAEALGIYGRAYQIVTLPFSYIGQVIDRVSFPAMAKIQDDKNKLRAIYLAAMSVGLQILIPTGIIIAVVAQELVSILLGPNWGAVIIPLQILAACTSLRIVTRITDSLVRALGAVYHSALRKALFAIAVVVGSWAGHYWALPGVAIGVVLAVMINAILMTQLAMQLAEIRLRDIIGATMSGLALGAVAFVFSMPLSIMMRQSALPSVIVLGGVVLTTTAGVLGVVVYRPALLGSHSQWLLERVVRTLPANSYATRIIYSLVGHVR